MFDWLNGKYICSSFMPVCMGISLEMNLKLDILLVMLLNEQIVFCFVFSLMFVTLAGVKMSHVLKMKFLHLVGLC